MITVFSFIMAFFWSSLMILMVSFLRNRLRISLKIDTILLVSLYIACMVRFFVPIEFTFVNVIGLKNIYTKIYTILDTILYENIFRLNFISLIFIISISICVVKFILFFKAYYEKINLYIRSCTNSSEREEKILAEIKTALQKSIKIRILYSPLVKSPITFGIFKKIILLPNISLADQDLHYIILHEYMHHLNKDLLIKMLTSLFCIVFWWNPFVYLLNKNLDETLELKCDLSITSKMSNLEKSNYLETILKFVNNDYANSTVSFGMVGNSLISFTEERFNVVLEANKANIKNKILSTIILFIFISTFVLSYMFIVQPAYVPTNEELEIEGDYFSVSNEMSIIIDNKDGTYTVIFDDENISIIDDYDFVQHMIENSGFILIEE